MWKRKEHFNFFYRADYPQYNVCMDIDVTSFLTFIRQKEISFYYAMIYSVIKVVNSMDNLKYRIRDGKVVLHDVVHPSFTDMNKDKNDDLFKVVTLEMKDNILDFVDYAKSVVIIQRRIHPIPDRRKVQRSFRAVCQFSHQLCA